MKNETKTGELRWLKKRFRTTIERRTIECWVEEAARYTSVGDFVYDPKEKVPPNANLTDVILKLIGDPFWDPSLPTECRAIALILLRILAHLVARFPDALCFFKYRGTIWIKDPLLRKEEIRKLFWFPTKKFVQWKKVYAGLSCDPDDIFHGKASAHYILPRWGEEGERYRPLVCYDFETMARLILWDLDVVNLPFYLVRKEALPLWKEVYDEPLEEQLKACHFIAYPSAENHEMPIYSSTLTYEDIVRAASWFKPMPWEKFVQMGYPIERSYRLYRRLVREYKELVEEQGTNKRRKRAGRKRARKGKK